MKLKYIFLCCMLFPLAGWSQVTSKTIPPDAVKGDFNGDGKAGYVVIRYSKMTDSDIKIKTKRLRLVKGGFAIPKPA